MQNQEQIKNSLLNFQKAFVSFIDKEKWNSQQFSQIIPGGRIKNAKKSMEVYKHGKIARLGECLEALFPCVLRIIGHEKFYILSEEYIRNKPSNNYNIELIGAKFPEFIKKNTISTDFIFLHDVAEFEKKFENLFHKFTTSKKQIFENLSIQELESKKVKLHDHYFLYSSKYRIYDIWEQENAIDKDLRERNIYKPQHLIAYKRKQKIHVKEICASEYALISSLAEGLTVSDALTQLVQKASTNESKLAEIIQQCFCFLRQENLLGIFTGKTND